MKEDSGWKQGTSRSLLEYVAAEPESVALWLDQARRGFLQEGDFCAATRASIFLVVLLAWAGLEEEIQMVIDELRLAVRRAGRPGEAVFALYYLTNAVARGEHPEEAAAEALIRLRRCEQALGTNNHFSGADQGAGSSERRSSMKTQQMIQQQELKAERVQQELMEAEGPCQISLKAERDQEPAIAAIGGEGPASSAFELTINQKQPMTIELLALQVVITLHGPGAGASGAAC